MMATDHGYRRLLYVSVPATANLDADRISIIRVSQPANSLDGITGALWSSPEFYVQALEGAPDAVADTFLRINGDERHHSIKVLTDSIETDRCFGAWAMANGWDGSLPVTTARLRNLLLESGHVDAAGIAAKMHD